MNNIYFSRTDLQEAIETVIKAKSTNLNVELNAVGEISDVPKSITFVKDTNHNTITAIGVDYDHQGDEDYGFAYEVSMEYAQSEEFIDSLFNDDFNHDAEAFEFTAQNAYPNDIKEMVKDGEDFIDSLCYEISCLTNDISTYTTNNGWNMSLEDAIDALTDYVSIITDNKLDNDNEIMSVVNCAMDVYNDWLYFIGEEE